MDDKPQAILERNKRVETVLLRQNRLLQLRAVLVVAPLICLLIGVFPLALRSWKLFDQDMAGALPQKGIGVVTLVSATYSRGFGFNRYGLVRVQVAQKNVVVDAATLPTPQVGQKVLVTYRIGKSGQIVIDHLQPTQK